jgi:hypothetical protein
MAMEKIIWVVNYDSFDDLLRKAIEVKAAAVAVRTDNDIEGALPKAHAKGIKIYGWRWPSAKYDPAIKEAKKVVGLLAKGMDGYYVDPEGASGKPWDWDQKGLEALADDFCKRIKAAMNGSQVFGVTSHYRGKRVFGKLPWKTFFSHADVFLPQAYWRVDGGVVGHGIPADNYRASIGFWKDIGASPERIVPMAGELHHVTAAEIAQYAKVAAESGVDQLHFYTYESKVSDSVWAAIKNI